VLKLIAMEYTSDEIAKQLFIAKSTVDTHRKNLIGKLNVKNAVGLGLFAERNGLI
jgi:DNA-binding CsgD family transcriptional regulator